MKIALRDIELWYLKGRDFPLIAPYSARIPTFENHLGAINLLCLFETRLSNLSSTKKRHQKVISSVGGQKIFTDTRRPTQILLLKFQLGKFFNAPLSIFLVCYLPFFFLAKNLFYSLEISLSCLLAHTPTHTRTHAKCFWCIKPFKSLRSYPSIENYAWWSRLVSLFEYHIPISFNKF